MNYNQVLAKLDGRVSRKVTYNTYIRAHWCQPCMFPTEHPSGVTCASESECKQPCSECNVALTFHGKDIVLWYSDGRIVLNAHGNRSATTRRRFNQWLPKPFQVTFWRKHWMVTGGDYIDTTFTDGMTIQTEDSIK